MGKDSRKIVHTAGEACGSSRTRGWAGKELAKGMMLKKTITKKSQRKTSEKAEKPVAADSMDTEMVESATVEVPRFSLVKL